MTRDRRPLLAAGLTAVLSLTLLALAIGYGWLGADVGRGSQFCEAFRSECLKQPANTLSNAGFVVAGLAIAWHARLPSRLGDRLPAMPGLAAGYACVVVLLGPASAAMHATGTELGGRLDLLSMYLVASFAAAYALTRWWRRSSGTFWVLFAVMVVACELIGLYPGHVPVVAFSGNVAFAVLLVSAAVLEVRLWRRAEPGETRTRLGWGVASIGSMVVAFTIWNLSQGPWCDPHSLVQGHGVWHLLCALAAYLLFRLHASERTRP